jgi:hypothetical protein
MDKPQLMEILQSCFLLYEGISVEDLVSQGLSIKNINVGFKLKSYLEAHL